MGSYFICKKDNKMIFGKFKNQIVVNELKIKKRDEKIIKKFVEKCVVYRSCGIAVHNDHLETDLIVH